MSLTSYRAAPPRVMGGRKVIRALVVGVTFAAKNAIGAGCCPLFGRPGGDLLSHVLGRSTIGAEGFHGRVRDGIGCMAPRHDHQVVGTEEHEVRLVFVGPGVGPGDLVAACDGGVGSSRTSD